MKPSLFEHYAALKARYSGVVLLFRVGDFWEAFDEDADTLARVLSLARTSGDERRMAEFPHAHLDRLLLALVKAGFRGATCEPAVETPIPGAPTAIGGGPLIAEEGRPCSIARSS